MAVHPLKAILADISLIECIIRQIALIQVCHEFVESFVDREFQQDPVKLVFLAPFFELCQFISHEVQLCAWMCIHVHVKGSCLREFAVVSAVHFLGDGGFSVDDLIMGQRENIALIVVVHHGKSQLVVLLSSFICICLEIGQGVVHPAKIPFVVKAKSALPDSLSNTLVRGRIFCKKQAFRDTLFQSLVHGADKFKSSQVLAAVCVSLPVDQVSYRIHAKSVEVEFSQPVICGGLQEAAYLTSGMHKVAAAPFVASNCHVGVLV